ncbi:hypothetical protein CC86DRAFT_146812 [Ophiobolus disseminans]|uniref:Uncharacterized protein n=1 Tax=Ophiobolus disseminans TaxID=1469910 RepID=A0A6A6ZDM1_9PLEO|nr:hypothetical protein CC86DRAFT_146812 [Ophiobolus disseminans]
MDKILKGLHTLSSLLRLSTVPTPCQHTTSVSWAEVWHQIVNQYSRCISSVLYTRLTGIRPVAREFEVLSGDTYVNGLWQSNLVNDFLWYTNGIVSLAPQFTWYTVDCIST